MRMCTSGREKFSLEGVKYFLREADARVMLVTLKKKKKKKKERPKCLTNQFMFLEKAAIVLFSTARGELIRTATLERYT